MYGIECQAVHPVVLNTFMTFHTIFDVAGAPGGTIASCTLGVAIETARIRTSMRSYQITAPRAAERVTPCTRTGVGSGTLLRYARFVALQTDVGAVLCKNHQVLVARRVMGYPGHRLPGTVFNASFGWTYAAQCLDGTAW